MLLADLGADVVKVEPPEGDATRTWGPPWVGSEEAGTRTAAYFLAVNRNKRSVRVDLRTEPGKDILRRLLGRADVVVENFRVGGFARLGFDEAELRRINPRLVHLAISGYGTHGPDAERPGYDVVVQATGGLMSITGAPDARRRRADQGRRRDQRRRERAVRDDRRARRAAGARAVGPGSPDGARPGQRIDVSLLASTLAVLVNQAQNAFVSGAAPGRHGNAHPNIVPYETFETADGGSSWPSDPSASGCGSARRSGVPALAADPRFASNGERVVNRDVLRPLLAERLLTRASADWLAALEAAEVPCGPILDVVEAFAAPQAEALGMDVQVEHPVLGALHQVGFPFAFERTPPSIRSAPPLLGEHTDAVLGELGYDADEIRALRNGRVV